MKTKFRLVILIILISFNALGQNIEVIDTTLIVGLKNGRIIYANSIELKEPVFKPSYLLVNDNDKYDIKNISYYQDKTGYYLWSKIDGYSEDLRLKRELSGKINTYSRIATQYAHSQYGGTVSTVKIEYFQKDKGEVRKINYENLNLALSDNTESKLKLKEVNRLRALNIISAVVGGGLIIGGVTHMQNLNKQDGPPPYEDVSVKFSPLFFIGAATLTIPLFTGKPRKQKMKEAIEVYNR